MSQSDLENAAEESQDAAARPDAGGDPRQGVHGSGGYGDPGQDAETSLADPTEAEVAAGERSPAEDEPGNILGA